LIVNELEHEVVSRGKLVAVTYGAAGAALFEAGREVARARPPKVDAVDGTAAGDSFAACLVVSLLDGRTREESLVRACAAGAIAASRLGAQPSLPDAQELEAILAV
jgi:ribokinase